MGTLDTSGLTTVDTVVSGKVWIFQSVDNLSVLTIDIFPFNSVGAVDI